MKKKKAQVKKVRLVQDQGFDLLNRSFRSGKSGNDNTGMTFRAMTLEERKDSKQEIGDHILIHQESVAQINPFKLNEGLVI